ncbi:MAG: hypothetical protein HC877_09080 [Thioploca sp.]|nr:hypothetical protein [Thioploca sp.]
MTDFEWVQWLLFMLFSAVLPIRSIIRYVLKGINEGKPQDTFPRLDEEDFYERHYSQLYRPGDRKYNKIIELSNKARSIN